MFREYQETIHVRGFVQSEDGALAIDYERNDPTNDSALECGVCFTEISDCRSQFLDNYAESIEEET